ncbi:MAG TPA: nuclear transport factor 2 family protein [Roseomonas sp.]|nr:nuclear transport factor 2 family protein [Roseomonas sp.]
MPDALTEQNRSRVQEIYAAYLRGNLPFVLDALADDVSWASGDEAAAAPWCGCHAGRAGVEAYFAALAAACVIIDYHIGQVIADGDWVAVTATVRARYHHSGAEREIAKVDVLRLRDGQICEFREYYDTSQIAADLRR